MFRKHTGSSVTVWKGHPWKFSHSQAQMGRGSPLIYGICIYRSTVKLFSQKTLTRGATCCCQASNQVRQKIQRYISPHVFTLAAHQFRTKFDILVITFRALHDQAQELLVLYNSRTLRGSDQGSVLRCRLKTKGDCAFEVAAPTFWYSPTGCTLLLLLLFYDVDTNDTFKKQLKTHLCRLPLLNPSCFLLGLLFELLVCL